MTLNVQSLLTPAVVRHWEFAFSEKEYEVRFAQMSECPGCDGKHVRVFFETEWDEDVAEMPPWALVLTIFTEEDQTVVVIRHFLEGEPQAQIVVLPKDLANFFNTAAPELANSLRTLRSITRATGQGVTASASACVH